MRKLALLIVFFVIASCVLSPAQATYTPTDSNLKARTWFQDAKFGLFIHWGVYSVPADGEWYLNNKKLTNAEYEKFAPQFNPTEFDPAEWVRIAKQAGVKYITITSRHHDGFSMFATRQNKWNIVDATPYGRDPLKALADECHKQGIKLFFYYSELDWHHPDYYPRGGTGNFTGRPDRGNWDNYIAFMDAQLRELLTNYGEVGGIWFDGFWDKPQADWKLESTYRLIHSLQPAALIGNNHHQRPFPGEDFQMFEKDLPGQKTAEWNNASEVSSLPLETCDTINESWGYKKSDQNYRTPKQLIHYLVRAAGYNSNLLLNVGPMSNGKIQPEFIERLQAMGAWLDQNGETVYGTRGGPVTPRSWGVTTRKGNRVFVHVLDWQDEWLALPPITGVKTAKMFRTGTRVEMNRLSNGIVLRLPAQRDPVDTIVELEMKE